MQVALSGCPRRREVARPRATPPSTQRVRPLARCAGRPRVPIGVESGVALGAALERRTSHRHRAHHGGRALLWASPSRKSSDMGQQKGAGL
eukprot:scaffold88840_cov29-Tisochrysis_lutea.AAC.5